MRASPPSPTARRSFVLSFIQRHVDLAIRIVGMVVLARLIPPGEFGVYAVAAAVVGTLWLIGEFGLPPYLINRKSIDARTRGLVLGVAIAASGVVAAAIVATALWAPDGWLDAEIRAILVVLGLSIVPQPLATLFRAENQRDMRFAVLLHMNTLAVALGVGLAILLAALGGGAISMAFGNLAEALGLFVFAVWRGRPFPRPRFSLSGWRDILRFGGTASLIGVLLKLGEATPPVVIGLFAGYGPAGLFSRAWTVAGIFDRAVLQAVSPVVLPLLAQNVRSDEARHRERIGGLYVLKLAYLTALAWPFFACLAIWAGPVVHLLLGPKWLDAVPIVQLLCIAGAMMPFNQMNQKFFIALGLIERYLRIQAVTQAAKIAAVLALVPVSFELAALAVAVEQAVKSALTQRVLAAELPYRRSALRHAVSGSAAAAIGAVGMAGAVRVWAPDAYDFTALPAAGAAALAAWLAVIVLSGHPLRQELTRAWALPQRLLRRCP